MTFDLTLNLNTIIVPLVVSLSTLVIARKLNKKDKKRDEHEAIVKVLLDKLDAKKEEYLNAWKDEVNKNFCTIKTNTQKIADGLNDRVVYDHCNARMDKFDERIRQVGG